MSEMGQYRLFGTLDELVRFALESRPRWLVGNRPLRADIVAKVGGVHPGSNNRVGTSNFLNQHCA
jgi:hypothetical protein